MKTFFRLLLAHHLFTLLKIIIMSQFLPHKIKNPQMRWLA